MGFLIAISLILISPYAAISAIIIFAATPI